MAQVFDDGKVAFANNLDELIEYATRLRNMYGNIPLDHEIGLGEMPADCHVGFHDCGLKSVIEVDFTRNFCCRKW